LFGGGTYNILILPDANAPKYKKYKRVACIESEVCMTIKRGELYYADLSPVVGSEQGGVRPVLIVQNDVGNKYSPTIIAAAVTSKINKAKLPTHIELPSSTFGLAKDSVILLEQIRTLDKRRLKERIGELPLSTMDKVDKAILISLGCEK
jgi:mRNA interferase MazF